MNDNDLKIYLFIREKIKDPYVTQYIISLKKDMEKKENLKYHIHQYNYIVKPYINYKKKERKKYSLIFNENTYQIENDIDNEFFHKTNISHQVIELIQQLICIKNKKEQGCDDILYSILADEIHKNIRLFHS